MYVGEELDEHLVAQAKVETSSPSPEIVSEMSFHRGMLRGSWFWARDGYHATKAAPSIQRGLVAQEVATYATVVCSQLRLRCFAWGIAAGDERHQVTLVDIRGVFLGIHRAGGVREVAAGGRLWQMSRGAAAQAHVWNARRRARGRTCTPRHPDPSGSGGGQRAFVCSATV